jgi:phosphate transport system permease protein
MGASITEPGAGSGGPPPLTSSTSLSANGRSSSKFGDALFKTTTLVFALGLALLVVLIVFQMALNSKLTFAKFGWGFLTSSTWDPVHNVFGAAPFIYGTVVSSIISLILGVPVSIGIAVFLVELSPRPLQNPISFMVQLIAAIPSVVFGLWGIFVLAPLLRDHVYPALQKALGFLPLFQGQINGLGLMTSGLILSIMVVPIITAVTTDVLRAVPGSQREAALAMGATRWEATKVVLGAARSGISGAIILGLGRAIGETMAVTMVIGNRPEISSRLFAPSYTIAASIANEFTEATSNLYIQALIELGLILFFITFAINVLARLMVWSVTRGQGRGSVIG